MLEPYVLKGTSTVLRGERGSNIPDLPDYSKKATIHGDPWERYYFLCPISRQHEGYHSIREDALLDTIFPLVADEIKKAANLTAIIEKRTKSQQNPRALLDREIARTSQELENLNRKIGKLYEDYIDKLLDEREYVNMKAAYENKAATLRQHMESLSQRAAVVAEVSESNNRWIKAARDFQNPQKLTREMIEAIVERILIFSPERVEVVWKFRDEMALLEACVESIASINDDGKESA